MRRILLLVNPSLNGMVSDIFPASSRSLRRPGLRSSLWRRLQTGRRRMLLFAQCRNIWMPSSYAEAMVRSSTRAAGARGIRDTTRDLPLRHRETSSRRTREIPLNPIEAARWLLTAKTSCCTA